jgi:hypothetical protein
MALTKITKSGITNSAVDNNKIEADAVDATKIADNAISEEHLDATAITGNTELAETANANDILLIYDASAGVIKKILSSNVGLTAPTFSSVSPTNVLTGDGTGNATFTITGTGFDASVAAKLRTTGGADVDFDTVTRDSATQITAVIAISSLSNANEPYDVVIINGSGLQAVAIDQINIDAQPVYNTASGSLGSVPDGTRASASFDIEAYDPDSAGNVTFEIQSGSLPAGASTTTIHENGVSKFRISGTFSAVGGNTTSTFVLRAVDAASNTTSRSYSITILAPASESFTSSGTFSVPSGLTSLDVLVVGGGGAGGGAQPGAGALRSGGGGAGGLVFFPSYPVTPGGTITVTVGCGGAGIGPCSTARGNTGQPSSFGSPGDPGLGSGGVLTGNGGSGGGGAAMTAGACAQPGGSAGGGGISPATPHQGCGGTANQPTAPGNSGAYGFGYNGGQGDGGGAGGGGGAGANGQRGGSSPAGNQGGGPGGIGRAYTIADGTTSVYYAGGGGGAGVGPDFGTSGAGGQGGGGAAGDGYQSPGCGTGESGTANRGGGGGGKDENPGPSGAGGKGVVIVRY